jgi:hypothetical protein
VLIANTEGAGLTGAPAGRQEFGATVSAISQSTAPTNTMTPSSKYIINFKN